MKKLIFSLLFILGSLASYGQSQGLENILVEEITPTAAAISAEPKLAGAKTYRIFVKLAPGWSAQTATGMMFNPLILNTTTNFYNNDANGAVRPNTAAFRTHPTVDNPLYYDTWLTIGAYGDESRTASFSKIVPRSLDTWAPVNDGIALGVNPEAVTSLDPGSDFSSFDYADGSPFYSENVIYYNIVGITGASVENYVCMGQFTTTGAFNFEMPVQIGNGVRVELCVFRREVENHHEQSNLLRWPVSVVLPTASITDPAAGSIYFEPAIVTINANAVAGSAAINKVEFLVDGVKVGEDLTAPYSLPWTSAAKAGNTNLTVRAVDSDGNAGAESAIVGINVNGNAAPVVTGLTATPSPAYIADAITLKATVTDDVAVAGVVFKVDGNVVPGTVVKTVNDYTIVYTVAGAKGNRSWSVEATDNGTPAKVTTVNSTFTVGNKVPTISVAPASFSIVAGNDTTFVASVGDLDGSVSKVDFTIDGVTTTDASAPFEFTYVAIGSGSKTLNAVATDDNNATASASVTFSVVPPSGKDYELGILSELCSTSDVFCMPIKAAKAVSNVTGYDITVIFDHLKVNPTGIVNVVEGSSAFVGDRDYTSYNVHLYPGTDSMKISLWLNTTAPAGTTFTGAVGNTLACVEFSRLSTFGSNGTTSFSTRVLQESSTTGYKLNGATPGSYSTHRETEFAGSLSFWSDNSPIAYTAGINLITNIFGDKNPSVKVQPDVNGNFVYNITNGTKITIDRDGDNTFDVQTTIGGLDAYYTAKVTVDDANFKPSVYQLISMDVNRDGRVTAGDITQIQQRTVLHIGEFTQVGNEHRDWLFVPSTTVLTDDHYRISPSFPYAGSYGYYKNAVPQVSVVKDLEALQLVEYTKLPGNDTCTSIKSENFKGILLGDVTGNYAALAPSTKFKSGSLDATKFMVELRMKADNEYEMIISSANSDVINGYDFSFDCSKFTALTSASDIAKMNLASNLVDNRVLVSGYNLGSFKNGKLASISLKANDVVSLSDISVVTSTINESPVAFELSAKDVTGVEVVNGNEARVWPNPASDVLFVTVNEKATVTLLDVKGRVVVETIAYANENNEINVANLPAGVYLVKIVGKKVTETKIIVQK